MNGKYYYMDHAATEPLCEEALEAMIPYLKDSFGNASAVYALGLTARKAVEDSRKKTARLIGAETSELYFTSGGSESNNWALLKGAEAGWIRLAESNRHAGSDSEETRKIRGHIITDAIEHQTVLRTCAFLEKEGYDITYIKPNAEGRIAPEEIMRAVRPDTVLVSVMTANNEIGTVEPVQEIGMRLKEYEHSGGQKILFHTDAVQAVGHIPIDVSRLGVDLLSASAHKFSGPKGVGFLYMKKGTKLPSLIHGGEQEEGKRAGTENVAGIVGCARAAEISCEQMESWAAAETKVRDHLIRRLISEIPYTTLNGDRKNRLPNNVNICFRFVEGEPLLLLLGQKLIYASSGSACMSGSLAPSHVLLAIGVSHEDAYGSLRLTIGPETTIEDADYAVNEIKTAVAHLRERSPLYRQVCKKSGGQL
ncbi:MAG: cysteine desulfurase [Eubacterium sp.]|jgi:cysteine desulfurase|nr:cysteine desulfurase [Eubacterium sp.]